MLIEYGPAARKSVTTLMAVGEETTTLVSTKKLLLGSGIGALVGHLLLKRPFFGASLGALWILKPYLKK